MTAKPRKPLLVDLAWVAVVLFVLFVGYALSYAPLYRMSYGEISQQRQTWQAAFVPVEWLIDHTALDDPLFWWANLFGVGADMDLDSRERYRERFVRMMEETRNRRSLP